MIRFAFQSWYTDRKSPSHWETQSVLRSFPALAEREVLQVESPADADVLLVHTDEMPALPDHPCQVLLQRIDACQLAGSIRRVIERREVKLVCHYARFRDAADYNRFGDARHRHWIREQLGEKTFGANAPLSESALAKIRLLQNQLHWPSMDVHAQHCPLDNYRPIDAFWAGKVEPRGVVSHHRRWCVDRLSGIPGSVVAIGGKDRQPLGTTLYREMLQRSKIAVCPWGWGEGTERDFAAPLNGCLMIRPRTDYCEEIDLPPHIIPCEPDFSDLTERIDEALGLWPAVGLREHHKQHLLQLRRPETVAERLHALFNEALGV